MNIRSQLSEHEFRHSLSAESVRTLQVIVATLMAGTVLLAAVAFFTAGLPVPGNNIDGDTALMFSMVNVLFCLTAFTAAAVVPKRMFSDAELERTLEKSTTPYETALQLLRTSMIVRMALVESAAMFGMVTVIVAVPLSVMHSEPVYMVNVVPFLLFLAYGGLNFPTVDRIVSSFRSLIIHKG